MAKSKIQPAQDILRNASGELGDIILRAKNVHNFDSHLQDLLPKDLQKHCKVANFNKGSLLLYVDSGAIAAKFRYLKPSMLNDFRKHPGFGGLANIDIKIAPEMFQELQPEAEDEVYRELSSDVTQQLIEFIANTKDPAIKDSLEAFLSHVEKKE